MMEIIKKIRRKFKKIYAGKYLDLTKLEKVEKKEIKVYF